MVIIRDKLLSQRHYRPWKYAVDIEEWAPPPIPILQYPLLYVYLSVSGMSVTSNGFVQQVVPNINYVN